MIPNEILDRVRHIEIKSRGLVNGFLAGEYHSVFKGRGMEFAEVREYQPGDDVRSIDWNVTARQGRPYIKVYDEERELTVMLVVDGSASGAFGSNVRMKEDAGVEISALLAFSAVKNNDRVGLVMFTDEVELFIPPRKGRKHVLRVIRELLYFEPRGRRTSIAGALDYLDRILHRPSVLFLISDFQDTRFSRSLRTVSGRHDLTAIVLEDPRERELPDVGLVQLRDVETGDLLLVDTGDARLRHRFSRRRSRLAQRRSQELRRLRVDEIHLDTTQPYVEPLVRFFQARARRR